MKEERELDVSYIMSTIGRWFLLILLFVIIGGTSAIFYNYGAPIKYQSNTTLYVEPGMNANSVDYQGILTNQRMVKTYAEIIKSRSVINKVIKEFLKKNPKADVFTRNYAAAKNYEEYSKLVKSAKKAQNTLDAAKKGKFSLWQRIKNLGKNSSDIVKDCEISNYCGSESYACSIYGNCNFKIFEYCLS